MFWWLCKIYVSGKVLCRCWFENLRACHRNEWGTQRTSPRLLRSKPTNVTIWFHVALKYFSDDVAVFATRTERRIASQEIIQHMDYTWTIRLGPMIVNSYSAMHSNRLSHLVDKATLTDVYFCIAIVCTGFPDGQAREPPFRCGCSQSLQRVNWLGLDYSYCATITISTVAVPQYN